MDLLTYLSTKSLYNEPSPLCWLRSPFKELLWCVSQQTTTTTSITDSEIHFPYAPFTLANFVTDSDTVTMSSVLIVLTSSTQDRKVCTTH